MYTPPVFKPDRAACLAFAQARGFGSVSAWDGFKPIGSDRRCHFISLMPMTAHRGPPFMSRGTIRF